MADFSLGMSGGLKSLKMAESQIENSGFI